MKNKISSLQGARFFLFILIFLFHASIFENVKKSAVYQHIFAGGGIVGVAYFFVLSGFVTGLSQKQWGGIDVKLWLDEPLKKAKRLWPYHLFFLALSLPLYYNRVAEALVKQAGIILIDAFFLQSLFPMRSVWMSYNGVAWFASTLILLTLVVYPLRYADKVIIKKSVTPERTYKLILVLCILAIWIPAFLIHSNVQYWLYIFPPARLFEFVGGYYLGKIYLTKKQNSKQVSLVCTSVIEMIAVFLVFVYLILFPLMPEEIRRAAIYYPGAVLLIWILSTSAGWISTFLSSKVMVYLGNGTMVYFLSHQIVLKYVAKLAEKLNVGNGWLWTALSLGIVLLARPLLECMFRNILPKKAKCASGN